MDGSSIGMGIIQDVITTGKAGLTPASPTAPGYFSVGTSENTPARMSLILDCLKTPTAEQLKSRDKKCYVIPRGFGMTSFVYLAKDSNGTKSGK